jgi:sugar phosphate isomerase/epimerase
MFRPGLVSITFRPLSVEDICRRAAECGLEGIEWGGDVHAPAGDFDTAKRVARVTAEHGLAVAAYGTYYRVGVTDPEQWPATIESARHLGADLLRVWAGNEGSAAMDDAKRQRVIDDARRCADAAADAGLTLACEWHGNTLTDEADSARRFFDAVDHPALRTYWQPHQGMAPADCLADMDSALPRLAGLHVFQWVRGDDGKIDRRPLDEGDAVWPGYFEKAKTCPALARGAEMFALLEFVRGDDPDRLAAEAATLQRWLAAANPA